MSCRLLSLTVQLWCNASFHVLFDLNSGNNIHVITLQAHAGVKQVNGLLVYCDAGDGGAR